MNKRKKQRAFRILAIMLCLCMLPLTTSAYTAYEEVPDIVIDNFEPGNRSVTFFDIYNGNRYNRGDINDMPSLILATLRSENIQKNWADLFAKIIGTTPNAFWDYDNKGFEANFGKNGGRISDGFQMPLTMAGSIAEVKSALLGKVAGSINKVNTQQLTKVHPLAGIDYTGTVFYSTYHEQVTQVEGHRYNGFALMFYDFKIVPVVDDQPYHLATGDMTLDEAISTQDTNPGFSYEEMGTGEQKTYGMKNESSVTVNYSHTDTSSWSDDISNSFSASTSLAVTSTIGQQMNITGKVPLLAEGGLNGSFSISAENVLATTNTKTTAHSEGKEESTAVEIPVPPRTQLAFNTQASKTKMTLNYDCPVAITYKVAVMGINGKVYATSLGADFASYGNYDYIARFGENTNFQYANIDLYDRAVAHPQINGYEASVGKTTLVESQDKKSLPCAIDWNKVLNQTVGKKGASTGIEVVKQLTDYMPMSVTGGTVYEEYEGRTVKALEPVPMFPLAKVLLETSKPINVDGKIITDVTEIKMKVGETSNLLNSIELTGLDKDGWPYYGFAKTLGTWELINETNLGDKQLPVVGMTANPDTYMFTLEALTPGTVYAKYLINEDTYFDVSEKAATNDKVQTASIKITVEEDTTFDGSIKANGTVTAYVGDPALDLTGCEDISVSVYDSTGREVDAAVVWEARELPSKGITVTNNQLTVSKSGVFGIRARYMDKYSNWIDVNALNVDAEYLPVPDNYTPFVENDSIDPLKDTEFDISRSAYIEYLGHMTEFITGRMAPEPKTQTFTDVDYSQSYAKYVEYAAQMGLVVGDGNGNFKPNEKLTAEQMKLLMARYAAGVERMLPSDYQLVLDDETKSLLINWATYCATQSGLTADLLSHDNMNFLAMSKATKQDVVDYLYLLSGKIQ